MTDEQKKRRAVIDTLEDEISKARHILAIINAQIKEKEFETGGSYWYEFRAAMRQVELLNGENKWLRSRLKEQRYLNDELMKFRTPDEYMDKVATALALLPISSITKTYKETGIQPHTLKKVSEILSIKPTKAAKDEARQRMKDCELQDIDKRGGHNRKAIEMLVNGEVVITFDSIAEAERATSSNDLRNRIKSGKIINGVQFKYKEL